MTSRPSAALTLVFAVLRDLLEKKEKENGDLRSKLADLTQQLREATARKRAREGDVDGEGEGGDAGGGPAAKLARIEACLADVLDQARSDRRRIAALERKLAQPKAAGADADDMFW